jgi:hypothetical protein
MDDKLVNAAQLIASHIREPIPGDKYSDLASREPYIWGLTLADVAVAVCRILAAAEESCSAVRAGFVSPDQWPDADAERDAWALWDAAAGRVSIREGDKSNG